MTTTRGTNVETPTIAWPTVILISVNLAAYTAVTIAGLSSTVPWWAALALNTVFAYVAYTGLHESVHRNVSRSTPWLNTTIGMFGALPLYHNVELHKLTHLGHHAHLNNPEKDTDHWVASGNPLGVFVRCATLFLVHYKRGLQLCLASSTSNQRLRRALTQNALTILPIVLAGVFISWPLAIAIQVVPGLIAATILAFTFDWLPHYPHDSGDAREGTRVIEARGIWNVPLTLIYLWQNYHQAHHVRPTIPFYLYREQHYLDQQLR